MPAVFLSGPAVALTGTTPATVVAAPASGKQRQILSVAVLNRDTVQHTYTGKRNIGGTLYAYAPVTVDPGMVGELVSNSVVLAATNESFEVSVEAAEGTAAQANVAGFEVDSAGVSFNLASIAGTTTAVNAGDASAGAQRVVEAGAANVATGQVSVANTATQIVAARAGRKAVIVQNHGGADVFLGASGVTTSNGLKLKGVDGASIEVPTSGAVYGIVSSGTQTVSYMEVYP